MTGIVPDLITVSETNRINCQEISDNYFIDSRTFDGDREIECNAIPNS